MNRKKLYNHCYSESIIINVSVNVVVDWIIHLNTYNHVYRSVFAIHWRILLLKILSISVQPRSAFSTWIIRFASRNSKLFSQPADQRFVIAKNPIYLDARDILDNNDSSDETETRLLELLLQAKVSDCCRTSLYIENSKKKHVVDFMGDFQLFF